MALTIIYGSEVNYRPAAWHAIYETADGDYCREDLRGNWDKAEDAAKEAQELFDRIADYHAREHVISVRIERW